MNSGFYDSSFNKIENYTPNSPPPHTPLKVLPFLWFCSVFLSMRWLINTKYAANCEQNQEIFPNSDSPSTSPQELDFIDPSTSNLRKVYHSSLSQSWNILPPSLSPLCLSYANHYHSKTFLLHVLRTLWISVYAGLYSHQGHSGILIKPLSQKTKENI